MTKRAAHKAQTNRFRNRMNFIICPTTGKYGYHSRRQATIHLRKLQRRTGYPGAPYECPWCGHWHVGYREKR